MDAAQWNALHPIGTPVTAYPGIRPDDAHTGWPAERLETRTRSIAWNLGHGAPVVKVDGYAGGIALTHVDPAPAPAGDFVTVLDLDGQASSSSWAPVSTTR